MLKAKDIMTRDVLTVRPETDIISAARLLLEKHLNGLPVVDRDNRILGILCQSDLIVQQEKVPVPSFFSLLGGVIPLTPPQDIEAEIKKISAMTVQEAMTPDPVTVSPETGIDEIATLMVKKNIHTLPVQLNGLLVGIVGKEDVLRTLLPREG